MNTPTGPRADEPIDGQVRNLLWRLRARLVTPPSEQRVQADLDRLLLAAQDRAHTSPSAAASERPDVVGSAETFPDHPLSGETSAVVFGAADEAGAEPAATSFAAARERRARVSTSAFGRVAAAMVVLVVASGVAGAREGVVTLQALLGRGEAPVTAGTDEEPIIPPLAAGAEDRSSDPDDTTGSPAAEPEPEAAPEPVAPGPEPTTGAAPEAGSVESDDAVGGPAVEVDDEPVEAPGPTRQPSQDPDPAPSEDTESDPAEPAPAPVEEPVLAAPEQPADLDGFGGPRDCAEGDLTTCLPSGDSDEADAPAEDGEADRPGGTTEQDGDRTAADADERDQLAKRRFQSSSSFDEQAQRGDTAPTG